MLHSFKHIYQQWILHHPRAIIMVALVIVAYFGYHIPKFTLDASSESLTLEHNQSLEYYRSIKAQYGSDDFLVITYTPKKDDLLSDKTLAHIQSLKEALMTIERVESVLTLLDVPLINSPNVSLSELQQNIRTLAQKDTDKALARKEFIESPLYSNLLVDAEVTTTALLVHFKENTTYQQLLTQRDELRTKKRHNSLSAKEMAQLTEISEAFSQHNAALQKQLAQDIEDTRKIMDNYRDHAQLYLGGVPMIVADSIAFVRHDILTFGIGVILFLIILLSLAFRKLRWILLPMFSCSCVTIIMVGLLGLIGWPVTVVSSNFIALLLIITLSLMVHLIVRYREIHEIKGTQATQKEVVAETISKMAYPCFYTALTTIVAFSSLVVSNIRPVIDFGWMMTIGIMIAFILAFILFPATLMLLNISTPPTSQKITEHITHFFAHFIEKYRKTTLTFFLAFTLLGAAGVTLLTVENRFIDYYKESTEIYQGMELIDQKLGGTTPLDVIINAPSDFLTPIEEGDEDEELLAFYDTDEEEATIQDGYWFNVYMLDEIDAIHDYLDALPESGKVLSLSTAMRMLRSLNQEQPIDSFLLAVLFKKIPDIIKETLFTPYISSDGNQLRFSLRVFESDPSLRRDALLHTITHDLTTRFALEPEQIQLTGMLVLYNDLLQSLFTSQILTIAVVFIAIACMFMISFRNIPLAIVAIIPNMIAAVAVLGVMGWLSIPLDIMTITITAICIGIAVDNTIHYVHRFKEEFAKDHDYWASMQRAHHTIGKAMYYTAITITLGFSILTLSNFVPTIYFGILTGVSMLIALLADLALLPLLIVLLKPLGRHKHAR